MSRPLGTVSGAYERRPNVTYGVGLSAETSRLLMVAAARRNVPPASLLAEIVECVLQDRLLEAVLDDV